MTTTNPDSGNNTGMPDPFTRYLMALPAEAFARSLMSLPAEDVEWLTRAARRLVEGRATAAQLEAELAEYKARPDGLGEGS